MINATLGNLTEPVIATAALHAGQYSLVKGSVAGAIVTSALFMLGASFLVGGLKYHVQEYNRAGARLHAGLLLLAAVALISPSAIARTDLAAGATMTQQLSLGLAVLLVVGYGLGLLFSLKTHREIFAGAEQAEAGEHRRSFKLDRRLARGSDLSLDHRPCALAARVARGPPRLQRPRTTSGAAPLRSRCAEPSARKFRSSDVTYFISSHAWQAYE